MKNLLLLGVGALALSGASSPAAEINRDYHKTFEVREGARLQLFHGDGDVVLTTWDRDEVVVDVRYRATQKHIGVGSSHDYEVEFERDGDTILVRGRELGSFSIGIHSLYVSEHVFTIQAPPYVEVFARGEDGDVRAEGARREIDWSLADGDLEFEGVVSSRLRLELADGDLSLSGCEGDLEIRMQDGGVRVRDHGSGIVNVETADGDVDIRFLAGAEPDVTVVSQDGQVSIEIPKGSSATFLLTSEDGHVDVDVSAEQLERSTRGTYGEIGSGKGRIRVDTADGGISLTERG